MEQKKAKVLEQLQIMQDGAQKMIDAGWEYYVLHACCAVEFAKNVQELLQASERCYIQRTDKNGKKVREGDIIRYSFEDDDGEVIHDDFVIEYEDAGFSIGWKCTSVKHLESMLDMFPQDDFSKYITVIGNRFDNPELLEVRHGK